MSDNNNNNNNKVSSDPAKGVAVPKTLDDANTTPVVVGVARSAVSGKPTADQYRNHYEGPNGGGNGGGNGAEVVNPHGWSTGVCDCANDASSCWDIMLCHPCAIAMLFNKLNRDRSSVNWPMCAGVACLDVLLTGGLALFAEALLVRYQIRARYNMGRADNEESDSCSCLAFFKEFCIVGFCTVCATCQNHREMTLRGDWPGKVIIGEDPAEAVLRAPQEVTIV